MIDCIKKHDNFRFFRDRNVCFMEISKNDNGKPTVSVCPNNHICHYCSNLTNKYNPQEQKVHGSDPYACSNLTNKYNPQEPTAPCSCYENRSNLTNKYNPQELTSP